MTDSILRYAVKRQKKKGEYLLVGDKPLASIPFRRDTCERPVSNVPIDAKKKRKKSRIRDVENADELTGDGIQLLL